MPGADDLEDGLDYTFETSDNEDSKYPLTEDQLADESEEENIIERKDPDSTKKRFRNDKFAEKKKRKVEEITNLKSNVAKMDPQMVADYIAAKIKRKYPDLSAIELNEKILSEENISDTSEFSKERTLKKLPDFLNRYFKNILETEPRDKLIVFLAMSAIRVCDVHRELNVIAGSSLKLIKKNKLSYDIKMVSSKRSSVAVTTCGRIKKLLVEKVIDRSNIAALVVDSSYLDSKVQSIWDLDDTVSTLRELIRDSPLQIYLF